ncbi:MAG: type II toxin-antitoxin system HicA family toxin [Opitutae bacterium]|nr:type II toxin-antitoxin system HicA family toxin [Opitutae bacterium]
MGSVPVLKPTETCRILERLGFVLVRQRGAHVQYRHPDGRGTTVPMHKGRDIAPPLLRQIAKDISLTVDEFLAHRLYAARDRTDASRHVRTQRHALTRAAHQSPPHRPPHRRPRHRLAGDGRAPRVGTLRLARANEVARCFGPRSAFPIAG